MADASQIINPNISVIDPAGTILLMRSFERSMILIVGLLLVYLGYRLFINGVSGKASLKAKKGDGGLELLNAAPGLFFCFFGFMLVGLMSFKQISISYVGQSPNTSDEAIITVMMSSAKSAQENISTNSALKNKKISKNVLSDIRMEKNVKLIFNALSETINNLDFEEKIAVREAYASLYRDLGIQDRDIDPVNLMKISEENSDE